MAQSTRSVIYFILLVPLIVLATNDEHTCNLVPFFGILDCVNHNLNRIPVIMIGRSDVTVLQSTTSYQDNPQPLPVKHSSSLHDQQLFMKPVYKPLSHKHYLPFHEPRLPLKPVEPLNPLLCKHCLSLCNQQLFMKPVSKPLSHEYYLPFHEPRPLLKSV